MKAIDDKFQIVLHSFVDCRDRYVVSPINVVDWKLTSYF